MKRKLGYLLVIFISMFIFNDCIKAKDIASCKYDYNGETYEFTISTDSFLWVFEDQKLNKSQTTDVVYNFKDKDFIKKVYSGDSVSSCPLLSFATFKSSDDLYHVIDFTSSTSEPCGGIEETGYTCTAKTGVSGNLNILSSNVDVEESKEKVYCKNTYHDKDLGLVTAETFTDGNTNYFRLYDENNNLIGTAQPGSQFQVNEKWYSSPNNSSLYSTNCNAADLVLEANYDKVEVETGDVDGPGSNDQSSNNNNNLNFGVTERKCFKCGDTYFPIGLSTLTRNLFKLVKVLVPVVIIIMGMIDLLKAVMASDEKKMDEAKPKLLRKIISGVVIFLIFSIVQFVFSNLLGKNGLFSNSMLECVNYFISKEPAVVSCPKRPEMGSEPTGGSENNGGSGNNGGHNSSGQTVSSSIYNACAKYNNNFGDGSQCNADSRCQWQSAGPASGACLPINSGKVCTDFNSNDCESAINLNCKWSNEGSRCLDTKFANTCACANGCSCGDGKAAENCAKSCANGSNTSSGNANTYCAKYNNNSNRESQCNADSRCQWLSSGPASGSCIPINNGKVCTDFNSNDCENAINLNCKWSSEGSRCLDTKFANTCTCANGCSCGDGKAAENCARFCASSH